MTSLRWGDLTPTGNGYTVDLTLEGEAVAVLRHDGDTDSLIVGSETWPITGSPTSGFTATLPGGHVYTARGEKKKIGRAVVIQGDFSGAVYRFVNEVSSNWIIDDAHDRKVAQFTGAAHGVRHPVVELEDDPKIPLEHAIFAAFIARRALENKLLSMTMVFTICLALLAPFTAIVYLLS